MFRKEGGNILTIKPEEETKMRTMNSRIAGARVPIIRKGHRFVVQIKVEKKEEDCNVPKKIVSKRLEQQRWMKMMEDRS